MTIIESKKEEKIEETMDVRFDKLRRTGSLGGWQRVLYNYIVNRLGATYLIKVMDFINAKVMQSVPPETDDEEIKKIIKLALIDYVDSIL